ncbi:MAG: Tripartite ATP-independent periplasmic transporter DctQ component [Clostridiales bacterium]|nr:Tripartite ATP-independent periplasmic transporter DctQ component [Clostridiales bacterium]
MKLINRMTSVLEQLCAVMMIIMIVVVFMQVIARYFLHNSLTWSEELARYLLIWITFFGSALALKQGVHINVDLLLQVLPTNMKKVVLVINDISISAFLTVLLFKGIDLVRSTIHQPSPAIGIPIGLVYIVMPLSAIAMLLFLFNEFFKKVIKKESELDSHGTRSF